MTGLVKRCDRTRQDAVGRFTGHVGAAWHSLKTDAPDFAGAGGLAAAVREVTSDSVDRSTAGYEELEQEIEGLRRQLDEARKATDLRVAEAFREGREAGLAEASDGEDRRLEVLKEALAAAPRDFQAKSDDVEALAITIARTVLAKIFGEEKLDADLVLAAITRQLEQIDTAELRVVRVSADDFPDASGLAAIAERYPELTLHRDRQLGQGECMVELDLGRIDASPVRQWALADAQLAQLAEAGRSSG